MKKLLEVYCKIDDVLAVIIKHFCAVLLATMIVVCFVNTVGRYAFHHSFRAAEEIVILCAVWVTCVGASMTARADDHVTLDLLQELVKSNKVKAVLYAITRGLACAFLLLLLPANHIIHAVAQQNGVNAALPPGAALILVLLSIVLTLIGGIIPSRKAAHSDPVSALRSE